MRIGAGARLIFFALVLASVLPGGSALPGAAPEESWQTEVSGEPPSSAPGASVDQTPATSVETGAIQPKSPQPSYSVASAAAVKGGPDRTSFTLKLSRGVTAEVFTLANPYRVVVDLPDVVFNLGPEVGRQGVGLVRAFRYGLFAEGKGRIVIDTEGPVKIEKAAMSALSGGGISLDIDMSPTAAAAFGEGTGANRPGTQAAKAAEDVEPKPRKSGKPIILIDPGHGGIDAGAVGVSNLLEKTVVLGAGLELRRVLAETGRYDVRLTRTTDVFVSLDRRLKMCREMEADLFISLHADSLEQKEFAQNVRGATVYTLSERASDEQARKMAEKENASDLLAGIEASESDGAEQVKGILIDLMKRETSNFSMEFSNLLVKRLKQSIPMSRDYQRSAAFKVLKQTHAPAVLIELGYMSNNDDEKLLNSLDGRRRVAQAIANAVDTYFAERTARAAQPR